VLLWQQARCLLAKTAGTAFLLCTNLCCDGIVTWDLLGFGLMDRGGVVRAFLLDENC